MDESPVDFFLIGREEKWFLILTNKNQGKRVKGKIKIKLNKKKMFSKSVRNLNEGTNGAWSQIKDKKPTTFSKVLVLSSLL